MKLRFFAVCAALGLAACGQNEAPKQEAAPAPQTPMERILAQPAAEQLITAYQALAAYQQAHPEATPVCRNVRATESRGIVPENVEPDSIYAAHKGAAVYSINCGELRTRAVMDPREHWLVVYPPGGGDVAVVNCASPTGIDLCPRDIPTVSAPEATPGAATTP